MYSYQIFFLVMRTFKIYSLNNFQICNAVLLTIVCACVLRHVRLFVIPMDCSPTGSSVHGISRQEYWGGLPFPPPGDLPDPGIEPWLPELQAVSLPSEPPGKHLHTLPCVKQIASGRLLYSTGNSAQCSVMT